MASISFNAMRQAFLSMTSILIAISLQGCGETPPVDLKITCNDGSAPGSPCRGWSQSGSARGFLFDITYTCIDQNPGNTCKAWSQSGQVQQDSSGSCFPGDSIVLTPTGPKMMSEVVIGDEVLGRNPLTGEATFSSVKAWLHRDADATIPMIAFELNGGRVVASQGHSLATPNGFSFARDISEGHVLVAPNGSDVLVTRKNKESAKGLYSPWTKHGNFFVGSSAESVILAHSFGHVMWPELAEIPVRVIMALAEYFWPDIHEVDIHTDRSYIHPVMRRLAPLGGISFHSTEVFYVDELTGARSQRRLQGGAAAVAAAQNALKLAAATLLASVPPPVLSR